MQLTLAEYEALPEDDRYFDEVSRGYLIREPKPGDAHGRLVTLLSYRLMQYVEQHPGCGTVYTEAGFVLTGARVRHRPEHGVMLRILAPTRSQ